MQTILNHFKPSDGMGNPIFRPFFSCIKPWFQRRSHRETAQLVNLLWRQDASGAIKVNQGQYHTLDPVISLIPTWTIPTFSRNGEVTILWTVPWSFKKHGCTSHQLTKPIWRSPGSRSQVARLGYPFSLGFMMIYVSILRNMDAHLMAYNHTPLIQIINLTMALMREKLAQIDLLSMAHRPGAVLASWAA